ALAMQSTAAAANSPLSLHAALPIFTSDEEERQRQGYEMITTLRYAEEDGRLRCEAAVFSEGGEDLVEIRYGPAATLWRINLGWRSEEHTSELQSRENLVCRLLLEKK